MALWIILACMAFMIVIDAARGRGGMALADMTLLVFVFGVIAVVDLVVSRFVYTRDIAWTIAALLAFGFAVDAFYGYLAPERQRRRDQKLRRLLHGRKRA